MSNIAMSKSPTTYDISISSSIQDDSKVRGNKNNMGGENTEDSIAEEIGSEVNDEYDTEFSDND